MYDRCLRFFRYSREVWRRLKVETEKNGESRKEASPAKIKIKLTKNYEAGGGTGGSFLGEPGTLPRDFAN